MNIGEIVLFLIKNWDKIVKPFLSLLNLPTNISELKKLFIKGDKRKMNNSLYYEKLNVSAATDIEKAYKEVVANNKKYYRCITASGKIIGWHVPSNRFISAEKAEELYPEMIYKDGEQVWFINAEYQEENAPVYDNGGNEAEPTPVVEPVRVVEQPKEEIKVVDEQPNIAPIENIKKSAEETTAVFADMISKYTNTCNELEAERHRSAEKDKVIADLKKRLAEAEKRANDLDEEEENAIEKLDELKEAVRAFVEFYRSVENEQ